MFDLDPMMMVLRLAILVFAVVIHEVAHGFTAYLLGDPTAKNAKRLDINPVTHIDPFGTIVLPMVLSLTGSNIVFGYGKPMPVNPDNFRNRTRDSILVSLSGIAANFALAAAVAVLFRSLDLRTDHVIAVFLKEMCMINVVLGTFNLVPIPPFDASQVVAVLLPPYLAKRYTSLGRYGLLILILSFWLVGGLLFVFIHSAVYLLLGIPLL